MKVAIIEDEKLAAERLQDLINEIDPLIEVTAQLASVETAIRYLSLNKPDLLFLDIQLSDGLSFSIFDSVNVDSPIIFTTAYDHYAIKAFKLNSIDYLLKPVNKDDLTHSINKYKKLSPLQPIDFNQLLRSLTPEIKEYKKRFLIQFGQKLKMVDTASIAYFYAHGKNVFLSTFEGQSYPIDQTLDSLFDQLDPSNFFRINRKIIINLKSIKSLTPYSRSRIFLTLTPPPPKEIDPLVSIDRTPFFKQWLNK